MRPLALLCLVIAGLIALRGVDIGIRLAAPHPVTVAFSEGGDDAYYYFTVARNLAHGRGLTVDGVHWTSGFQPLWLLLTGVFFLVPWERASFALVYLASVGCWLASAWLAVVFVRRASTAPLDRFRALAIAALFLAERHLSSLYVNGMETGLQALITLALLVGFQEWLRKPPTDRRGAAVLGLLAGLAMLARNDLVFLCGALVAALLLDRARPYRLREAATVVAAASVLVLPWLAYCQWVGGMPLPQSGIATAQGVRAISDAETAWAGLGVSLVPLLVLKTQSIVADHPRMLSLLGVLAAAALAAFVLAPRRTVVDAASRRCLAALAASVALLMLYFLVVSNAAQFYQRYFADVKLLVLLLLFIALVRIRHRLLPGAIVVALLVAFATNVVQVTRDWGAPWRSHMGDTAYEILGSRYASDGSRLGVMESGRLGYLFPDRVVNLDGKMNLAALRALRRGTMVDYLRRSDLDHLLLQPYDVAFFDRQFPDWRQVYFPEPGLETIGLFTRVPN